MNRLAGLVVAWALLPSVLTGQEVSVSASRWLTDPRVMDYRLAIGGRPIGPIRLTPFTHFNFQGPRANGAMLAGAGVEARFSPFPRARPYLVVGASAGFLDLERRFGIGLWRAWSVGGGYELGTLGAVSAAAEIRYQALSRAATDGLSIGLRIGSPVGRHRTGGRAVPPSLEVMAPNGGPSLLQDDVVRAATAAMGTPYRWGGTDANGFDCSGLIQFAYSRVGVDLPRRAEDQARQGRAVPQQLELLAPGDILAFSAAPGGKVSHVGLYLGNGEFIHSASGGVKRSVLATEDPASRWWIDRWVDARRILD